MPRFSKIMFAMSFFYLCIASSSNLDGAGIFGLMFMIVACIPALLAGLDNVS